MATQPRALRLMVVGALALTLVVCGGAPAVAAPPTHAEEMFFELPEGSTGGTLLVHCQSGDVIDVLRFIDPFGAILGFRFVPAGGKGSGRLPAGVEITHQGDRNDGPDFGLVLTCSRKAPN
jgi:hypothetical protein